MRGKILGLCAALGVASCQLPPNVSDAGRPEVAGARAEFRQCAVSVAFSGEPRALHASEAAGITSSLGRLAEWAWQIAGVAYEDNRFAQLAVCLCSDREIDDETLARIEASIARSANFRLTKTDPVPFARKTIAAESPYRASQPELRMIFPRHAPRCMFVQGFAAHAASPQTAQAFFATLAPD